MKTPDEYAAEIAIAAANLSHVTGPATTLSTLLALCNHVMNEINDPQRDTATADLFGDDNGTDNDDHNH